ncbi:RCC1 domain-containing protein [Anaerovorax odorimutans]|uniref:RCC1 domain-containing protein n=1 Tax=Anaerovorax odorimutans TaxID=109327 RepID=UPI000425BFBE|nr:fibronectin type III domain-containing protein [Anaerovorax odorimutans]
MYSRKVTKWKTSISILLILLMIISMCGINSTISIAEGGMEVTLDQTATIISSDESQVYSELSAAVDPSQLNLAWNFGNGFDRKLEKNLELITLTKKEPNEMISISRDDFKYINEGQGDGKVRRLELSLSTILEDNCRYVIKMDKKFAANNGSTIGKDYSWEFITAATSAKDVIAPIWAEGSSILKTASTESSVDLEWPAATDNIGVTAYHVYRNDETEAIATVNGKTLTCHITGLEADTTYNFTVEAVDAAGNSNKELTTEVKTDKKDNTVPNWSDDSKLTASSICSSSLILSWTSAIDNIEVTAYHIYRNNETEAIATVKGTTLNYKVTDLEADTSYNFRVEAEDANGNCTQNGPCITVSTAAASGPVDPDASMMKVMSAGEYYTVFLKKDGTIWSWGANDKDQLGNGNDEDMNKIPQKIEVTGTFQSVATGQYHTLALKDNGTVWTWGGNSNGQLGDGTKNSHNKPVAIEGASGFSAIAAGRYHSLALKKDGSVWAWGYNNKGQLGLGSNAEDKVLEPTKIEGLDGVIALAGGCYHSIALKEDGSVWTWGYNYYGQLGDGTTTSHNSPTKIEGLTDVVMISSGEDFCLAMKKDGSVYSWGKNDYGQLGNDTVGSKSLVPVQVAGESGQGNLSSVTSIAAGKRNGAALISDGTVKTWGYNRWGQLGDGTSDYSAKSKVPINVTGISGVIAIALGDDHALALKKDGSLWSWGHNDVGQLGNGFGGNTFDMCLVPTKTLISDYPDKIVPVWTDANLEGVDLAPDSLTLQWSGASDDSGIKEYYVYQDDLLIDTVSGDKNSCDIRNLEKGKTYNFKVQASDISDNNSTDGPTVTLIAGGSATQQAGFDFSLSSPACSTISISDKRIVNLICNNIQPDTVNLKWNLPSKLNDNYISYIKLSKKHSGEQIDIHPEELVYSDSENKVTLEFKKSLEPFTSYIIEMGPDLSVDNGDRLGKTYAWEFTTMPKDGIQSKIISAGEGYSLAVKSDGSVWSWGDSANCRLGRNKIIDSKVPAQLKGINGFTALSAGRYHSLALRNDGTVWVWGGNNYRQLGDKNDEEREQPYQLQDFRDVVSIGAGYYHSLAVKSDGSVWSWGNGSSGQLGLGDNAENKIDTPTKIEGFVNAKSVYGGDSHTLCLKKDGTIWTWGKNTYGQLGDGSTSSKKSPQQVTGINDVTAIAVGANHNLALKKDGTVWAWGDNSKGQLGLGEGADTKVLTPSNVPGLIDIIAIDARERHSLALKKDGTVWAWGYNAYGQVGNNSKLDSKVPVQIEISNVAAIAAGWDHSIAVKNNGTCWTWGRNNAGQIGNGESGYSEVNLTPIKNLMIMATDSIKSNWPEGSSLKSSNITQSSVMLEWTAAKDNIGVTAYRIYQDSKLIKTVAGDVTSYQVEGLSSDKKYTFKVEAGDGSGNWSNNGPSITIMTSPGPAILVSASVERNGRNILLKFSKAMSDPAGNKEAFILNLNGEDIQYKAIELKKDTTEIQLQLLNPAFSNDVLKINCKDSILTAEDGMKLADIIDANVINNAPVKIDKNEISFDNNNKDLAVTENTPSVTINVPENVSDAAINVANIMESAVDNKIKTKALPALKIDVANSSISAEASIIVNIPKGVSITASSEWDGTINVPKVISKDKAKVKADTGKEIKEVTAVIEMGDSDLTLNFDKAVKIIIPGQAGKDAGYQKGDSFTSITTVLTGTTQEEIEAEMLAKKVQEGKMNVGNDMVIWTKHFTSFITYTQTTTDDGNSGGDSGGSNGGDSGGSSSDPNKGTKPLNIIGVTLSTISGNVSTGGDSVTSVKVSTKPLIRIEADKNVTESNIWEKNKRCITLTDSNGKDVSIKVSKLYEDQDTFDERKYIFIEPKSDLRNEEKYTIHISPDLLAKNGNTLGSSNGNKEYTISFSTLSSSTSATSATPVKETNKINPLEENRLSKLGELEICIPKGAIKGSKQVILTAKKVENPGALSNGNTLISNVYEFMIDNEKTYTFEDNIEITLNFDNTKIPDGYMAVLAYYNENGGKWIVIGGTVNDNRITANVKHFTKFAVLSVPKESIKFTDISSYWAEANIISLVQKGIINGYDDNTFRPNSSITRAEFAKILTNAFELKATKKVSFSDVKDSSWYSESVSALVENEIALGMGNGKFGANEKITRQDMAVMLYKAMQKKNIKIDNTRAFPTFKDSQKISNYAEEAVKSTYNCAVFNGVSKEYFQPKGQATRGQVAAVIDRILTKTK